MRRIERSGMSRSLCAVPIRLFADGDTVDAGASLVCKRAAVSLPIMFMIMVGAGVRGLARMEIGDGSMVKWSGTACQVVASLNQARYLAGAMNSIGIIRHHPASPAKDT